MQEESGINKENNYLSEEILKEENRVKPKSTASPSLIKHRNKQGNPSPRRPLDQIDLNEPKSNTKLENQHPNMVAIPKKLLVQFNQEEFCEKNTTKLQGKPEKSVKKDQNLCSATEKATMTDLSGAEIDLLMANFDNFKKAYQVIGILIVDS